MRLQRRRPVWQRRRLGQVRFHVFTRDAATHAGAFDGAGIEIVFGDQATNRRAERVIAFFFQARGSAGQAWLLSLGSSQRSACRSCRPTDAAEQLARQHGRALFFHDSIENARFTGRHFQHDFVGFDFNQDFITLHAVARFCARWLRSHRQPIQEGQEPEYLRYSFSFPLSFYHLLAGPSASERTLVNIQRVVHQSLLLLLVYGHIAHRRRSGGRTSCVT